jgi:Ser/Thr protein kinase RdoA (MazF antagonist)
MQIESEKAVFDYLTPEVVISAVESAYGISLDGTWNSFPSYVNRVYGLRDDEGKRFVVKFYRPRRWSYEAIGDEHRFLADCAADELPVVAPVADEDGVTLQELELGDLPFGFIFALFPLRAGRSFDLDRDEEWLRLGALIGRLHRVGKDRTADSRLLWLPETSSRHLDMLLEEDLIPSSVRRDFESLCRGLIEEISPLFASVPLHRIHGDCHRGNILERPGEGLLLIDFDDMVNGPAVQDLWLLLPGNIVDSGYQFMLLKEGYEQFSRLPGGEEQLIEPLRFMRMLHYLTWSAQQRGDRGFREQYPAWGTESFWIKEIADFRDQYDQIRRGRSQ